MLNAAWLNAAPLNSPGATSRVVLLGVAATAGATVESLGLRVRKRLAVNATASATLGTLNVTRKRGLAAAITATAVTVGEPSVEIGGVVHAYLSVNATAGATIDPPALRCVCPLAVDATAEAVADALLYRRRGLAAEAVVTAGIAEPFLHARVNLGALPPGQDSIVGTQRIRAFAFVSADLRRKRRLGVNAAATATLTPAPRLALRVRLAVNATAGTRDPASGDDATATRLFLRKRLAVDATAGVEDTPFPLYTRVRLAVNATATAASEATLYMNIFDQAPTTRTVRVAYNPRTVVVPPPRREVDVPP